MDVENLTFADAEEIYRTEYWHRAGCDQFTDKVAAYVFDIAVPSGYTEADVILQTALGVVADGKIGPQTVTAEHQQAETDVLNKLLALRLNYYNMIVQAKPDQRKFLNGWTNRAKTFMQRYATFA